MARRFERSASSHTSYVIHKTVEETGLWLVGADRNIQEPAPSNDWLLTYEELGDAGTQLAKLVQDMVD